MNVAGKTTAGVRFSLAAACLLGLFATQAHAQMFVRDLEDPAANDGGDSYGCSLVDFNGDGYVDLFVANEGTALEPARNFVYLNDGAGNFFRTNGFAMSVLPGMSRAGLWADVNNDGLLDLFVVNRDYQHNFFYQNIGTPTEPDFEQIFVGPHVNDGIDENVFSGSSLDADIGDYNLDGFLDIIVVNRDRERNFLFRNQAGNGFQRINGLAITEDREASRGCSWFDVDDDGDLDLYVFNDRQPNTMYRNNLDDNDWTRRVGGALPLVEGRARGVAWGDYDNDGLIDAVVIHSNELNLVYKNFGGGFFRYQPESLPATEGGACVSAAWGDYDNDADLDLIISNTNDRNIMYNNDGGVFTRVNDEPPAQDISGATGLAFADINNDGFLDLFVSNRNEENNQLYRNQTNGNNWVKVRLRGFGSNRQGVGSVIRVTAEINGETLVQTRTLTTRSGPLSQSGLEAHFGLNTADAITEISVQFPSGDVQTLSNPAVNTRHLIEESPTTSVAYAAADAIDFALAPHPLNPGSMQSATISWAQPQAGQVSFALYAQDGSLVANVPARWFEAGSARVQLSDLQMVAGGRIAAGVYLLRLTSNARSFDAAIVIGSL